MPDPRPLLTLAHSPDPDDAFMWWPITGKVTPSGTQLTPPAIDTGRFRFQAIPADIEVLNRRAADAADLDITALSFRAWAQVRDKYIITRAGSSFGDGYGPKVVCPRNSEAVHCENCLRNKDIRIAIPGRRTTAFLVLGMMLGWHRRPACAGATDAQLEEPSQAARIIEMPFDQVIPAVARGDAEAGLVIHEGQVLYEAAGLRLVVDLGEWWKRKTGLPLPLGCNAARRDIDERFGKGSLAEVSATLKRSVEHALAHRAESLEYTLPFALANAQKSDKREPRVQARETSSTAQTASPSSRPASSPLSRVEQPIQTLKPNTSSPQRGEQPSTSPAQASSSPQRGERLLPGVALHPWLEPTTLPSSSSSSSSSRPSGANDAHTHDTIPEALAPNTNSATLDQIDRYITMYVNRWSVDLGEEGRGALTRLFKEGESAGLCEAVPIDIV